MKNKTFIAELEAAAPVFYPISAFKPAASNQQQYKG
jgi:hypothetical protein